ncbi:glycosyltransferase involved in cell wall biosynthesis [Cryobacterium mesophilum]|uniref:glycosyltransferase n=1 Tax=Terrimesophilobacter mesophilus TaxID=433647 RepID=UPI0017A660EF|nr:glycosyltransferase [Terrimesophilobacter mesophilus]MBB5632216.1 glycosyltransferase involved in cell wall biosynthesis [Terrimesophilobacter mesophilus]
MPDASHDSAHDAGRPLRILIGADTFAPDVNGAASFTSRLAAGLVERGHEVHIEAPAFSRKHGRFIEEHEGANLIVHRVYSWRWFPHDWLRFVLPWRSQAHAARILDEVKPDVVHIQSHIVIGRGLARQATTRGIRVIATNHFMPENLIQHTLLPKFLRKTAIRIAWNDAAKTYHLCEAITTPTRKGAEFLEAATDLTGVHAISCGINSSEYTPSFAKKTENRILFVGRVTGEKHIDVLIRAVARLDPSLEAKLEIVGGGDLMNHLKKLASDLGVADRTTFTGYVSEEELKAAYTNATVFAIPSIAELQSIATMEAMSSGLPVVAANAMALPHLVHSGENGYLFEPENVDDLAQKLTTVLTASDDELTRMKRNSLKLIAPHDIQRTLTTFERLYRGEAVTDPVTEVSLDEQAS